jgi:hypothetical protein
MSVYPISPTSQILSRHDLVHLPSGLATNNLSLFTASYSVVGLTLPCFGVEAGLEYLD